MLNGNHVSGGSPVKDLGMNKLVKRSFDAFLCIKALTISRGIHKMQFQVGYCPIVIMSTCCVHFPLDIDYEPTKNGNDCAVGRVLLKLDSTAR